jgi:photosystem II stability/assembly factor-like uncharacterized protein
MKRILKNALFFCFLLINSLLCRSQCSIEAGNNQTIICGGSIQLNSLSKVQRIYSDTSITLNSSYFTDPDTGYVVGLSASKNNGIILKTVNGGKNWTAQNSQVSNILNSVFFTNPNTGYVVGGTGTLLETTNGGNNWNKIPLYINTYDYSNLNSVVFVNPDIGYIGNTSGIMIKTTDGGTNWNALNTDSLTFGSTSSIYFVDANIGYAVGTNYGFWPILGVISKTIDGGKSWTTIASDTLGELHSVYFTDANIGYIVGYDSKNEPWPGIILKTTDGGEHWKLNAKVPNSVLNSVRFITANTGIITGTKGMILKTTDAGKTWNILPKYYAKNLNSINFRDTNSCVIIGEGTGICELNFPISYSWSPSIGLSDSAISNPIAAPRETTTFTLKAQYESSCTATDSVKVIVNSFEAIANDVIVSCGNAAQLNVSSNYTGTDTLKFQWIPSDYLSDPYISNPVANGGEARSYSVEISTANGCASTKMVNISYSNIDIQPSICMVTVDNNFKNIVVWQKPVSDYIDGFLIYRESNLQTGLYDLIGKIPYLSQSVFIDSSSNALIQSNRYKIAIKDKCNNTTPLSTDHKTIHLSIYQAQGNNWNLTWEGYEGFLVSSYKIYRGSTINDLNLIGSVAAGNTSYSDISASAGEIFYQLDVLPSNNCSIDSSANFLTSRSNIASNTALGIFGSNADSKIFKVYPIPARDELFFNIPIHINACASIFTIDGRSIVNANTKGSETSIYIKELPAGMYILKITDNRTTYTARFIKE